MKPQVLLLLVTVGLFLFGCTSSGDLTPQAQKFFTAACKSDQGVQPIAASVLSQLLPQSTPAVALENAFIHPAVVKYCEGLGQTAVAVPVTVAPAALAPAKQ